jgi:vacuolar protein sorting-associated protein 13A/C
VESPINDAKSRLLFAGKAILEGVRERNRKWTWAYFAERRDDRNRYVEVFCAKLLKVITDTVSLCLLIYSAAITFAERT